MVLPSFRGKIIVQTIVNVQQKNKMKHLTAVAGHARQYNQNK